MTTTFGVMPDFRQFQEKALSFIKTGTFDIRKKFAKHRLEATLHEIIATVNGHRKKKLPKHSPAYQVLALKAQTAIADFCREYDVPTSDIYQQIPAMREIEAWGSPAPAPGSKTGVVIGGVVSAAFAAVAVGFLSGSFHQLYVWGNHFAHFVFRG